MSKYQDNITNTLLLLKEKYLDKYVFYDLHDLNSGFDAESIRYFTETEFQTVLTRVEAQGLGVLGIEPWRNGHYYDVLTYEELGDNPLDPDWYNFAFKEFKSRHLVLQYSATYYIPQELLKLVK